MTTKKKQRSIKDLRADVLTIRGALQASLIERDDLIDCLITSFVVQEHTVLFGSPGTGKSYAVQALASCVDARYVQRLLHKFMTPDELIGPMDLKEFQSVGRFRRVLKGGCAAAEMLNLEEIFDANSPLLRSLLSILNERVFEDQSGKIDVPLRQCTSSTNFYPDDKALDALYDRFLFRYEVQPIQLRANRIKLLRMKANMAKRDQVFRPPCVLTVDDWDRILADVEKVVIQDGILEKFEDFRDLLAADGIGLSDRRAVQLLRAFKAQAWLDGESDVDVEHLQILRFCAWKTPAERVKCEAFLKTLERSEVAEVIEQIDEALRAFADRPRDQVRAVQDLPKLLSQIHTVHEGVKARLAADEFSVRGAEKINRRVSELSVAHDQLNVEFSAAVRI